MTCQQRLIKRFARNYKSAMREDDFYRSMYYQGRLDSMLTTFMGMCTEADDWKASRKMERLCEKARDHRYGLDDQQSTGGTP